MELAGTKCRVHWRCTFRTKGVIGLSAYQEIFRVPHVLEGALCTDKTALHTLILEDGGLTETL